MAVMNHSFLKVTVRDGYPWSGSANTLLIRDGRILALCLAIFTCYSSAAAQHKWETLSSQDGLVHNEAYDVLRSTDGAIWIATRGGVQEWRGDEIGPNSAIRSSNSNLINDWVMDLEANSDSTMLAASVLGGLFEINLRTSSVTHLRASDSCRSSNLEPRINSVTPISPDVY